VLDRRIPWRSFLQDWIAAALALLGYVLAAFLVSGASATGPALVALGPQAMLSVLLFPAAARLVATLDRVRLTRYRSTS